jgi:hypothetical protein
MPSNLRLFVGGDRLEQLVLRFWVIIFFCWSLSILGTNPGCFEGRPWVFEGCLFSVADYNGDIPPIQMDFEKVAFWTRMFNLPLSCMSEAMGVQIGNSVGFVEEVDTEEDGVGWGAYLRVKIRMDISRPLARGRVLKLNGVTTWVAFQYEKLPKFCYHCGIIKHGELGCLHRKGVLSQQVNSKLQQFGSWLRVPPVYNRFPSGRGWGDRNREAQTTSPDHQGVSVSNEAVESHNEKFPQKEGSQTGVQFVPTRVVVTSGGDQGGVCSMTVPMDGDFGTQHHVIQKEILLDTSPNVMPSLDHVSLNCGEPRISPQSVARDVYPEGVSGDQQKEGFLKECFSGKSPNELSMHDTVPSFNEGLVNIPVAQGGVGSSVLSGSSQIKHQEASHHHIPVVHDRRWKRKDRPGRGSATELPVSAGGSVKKRKGKQAGLEAEGARMGKKGRKFSTKEKITEAEAEFQPRLAP